MNCIVKLEEMGYKFAPSDSDLNIIFTSGKIPDQLEEELLFKEVDDNKDKAITFIRERENRENHIKAIEAEYLPFEYAKCYGKQLTSNSHVFIHRIDDVEVWTGYRITYNQANDIVSEKTIIEHQSFKIVFNRVEIYIKNYMDFILKIKAN